MRWCSLVWRRLIVSVVLLVSSTALAETLVVYPLESQDVLLGTAVSDQVAVAFERQFDIIGPDVAPLLVPPIVGSGRLSEPHRLSGDRPKGERRSGLFRWSAISA